MRTLFSFVVCTVLLVSCLEPDGENYRELTVPSTVVLELTGIPLQPIVIDRPTTFQYVHEGLPIQVIEASVYFGELRAPDSHAGTGVYLVDPTRIPSGSYIMRVSVTGWVQNGSVASQLGAEKVTLTNEYQVIVDSAPPEPLEVIKFENADGKLKVYWNKSRRSNFEAYALMRCISGNCIKIEKQNVNDTSWIDSDYIGGPVEYYVSVQSVISTVTGQAKTYEWKPEMQSEVKNQQVTLRWRKFPYATNIDKFTMTTHTGYPIDLPIGDTVITIPDKVEFGDFKTARLSVTPKSGANIAFESVFYVGKLHEPPVVIPRVYNAQAKLYYGYDWPSFGSVSVRVMDVDLNEVHREYSSLSIASSPNGQHLIGMLNGAFYKLDPSTLDRTLILDRGTPSVSDFSVADNGLLSFYEGGIFKVYEPTSGLVKFSAAAFQRGKLSTSGNSVMVSDRKVYRYNAGAFTLTGTLPADVDPLAYDLNDKIIGTTGTQTNLYDDQTCTLIKSLNMGTGNVHSVVVDPVSGTYTYVLQGIYHIYQPAEDRYILSTSSLPVTLNDHTFGVGFQGSVFSIQTEELFK